MKSDFKGNSLFLIFLIIIIVSTGCVTISPVTPTLTTSAVTQESTLSPTGIPSLPDQAATSSYVATASIKAIVSTIEPYMLAEYPSRDGKWSVEIIRYECSNPSGDANTESLAYEQVRLKDLSTGKESIVADQIQNCGGLGTFGFEGLYWSASSHYFYYSDSREGQPDGGCGNYLSLPIYRLDTETQEFVKLDGGFLSPDNQKIAMWHGHDIVIWDLDQGEIGRATPARIKLFNGQIWWSQKSDAIRYLQTEFECAPNFGRGYITNLDTTNMSQSLAITIASLDTSTVQTPPAGLFVLSSYKPLVMEYDATQWQDLSLYAAGDSIVNYLESKELRTCYIVAHLPERLNLPYATEIKRIGRFNFTIVTLNEISPDFTHRFYLADQYIAGYDLRRGAPVIEVGAIPDEWDRCKVLAEEVLSTLHPVTE